jgi:hypothetical protein
VGGEPAQGHMPVSAKHYLLKRPAPGRCCSACAACAASASSSLPDPATSACASSFAFTCAAFAYAAPASAEHHGLLRERRAWGCRAAACSRAASTRPRPPPPIPHTRSCPPTTHRTAGGAAGCRRVIDRTLQLRAQPRNAPLVSCPGRVRHRRACRRPAPRRGHYPPPHPLCGVPKEDLRLTVHQLLHQRRWRRRRWRRRRRR